MTPACPLSFMRVIWSTRHSSGIRGSSLKPHLIKISSKSDTSASIVSARAASSRTRSGHCSVSVWPSHSSSSYVTWHQPFAATRLTLPLRPVASTTMLSPTFRGGCSGSGLEGSSVLFRRIRRQRLRSGRRFGVASSSTAATASSAAVAVASSSVAARVADFTRSDGATRTGGATKHMAWCSRNAARIEVLISAVLTPFVCKIFTASYRRSCCCKKSK
mmetsp:Transcript_23676/g.61840  ORF Transcript_23676/g.61840 Transcript_23676/m.61840 type:complete len:218 (-) Transcript_23676:82-735(-)